MTYLGIDVGTSEVKVILVDDEQDILATGSVKLNLSNPHPLWSEQNPEDWWEATLQAVGIVRASVPYPFSNLQGIGLSGQMHGATLLDKAHKVMRPAILWNDTRAHAECAELEALAPHSRAITGNLAMPGFTAPKLLWLKKNEPAIFEQIDKVLLPKDYIAFRLTDEFTSDMSDAAGTLWLDVAKRDWSDEMLLATGLSRENMPRLIEGNQIAGQLCSSLMRNWGLEHPVMVAGGAGDNAATAIGMGAIAPGNAFLSLGTSGVLFVCNDRFMPNPEQAVHAFCHCLPQRWHQMSVILSAASSLAWAARVTQTPEAGELAQLAETADAAQAPIFLPYLSGERTPHNNAQASGVFFGLRGATERAALAYSVMEGVAFAMADGYQALRSTGTVVTHASFVGGGSRSRFWAELIASATGITLLRHKDGDFGGAYGASRLARLAVTGEMPESVCTMPPVAEEISPNATLRAILPERLARYRRLYTALKPEFSIA
ncbi:xylulokinase [Glaciimonas sp. PCH181]|uniref:xylulokinase n=1 Tax=Glaciimonas sp. PCH181 TaxID=2133943 RepID=UPI000D38109C|nr:xylulokinase [Glaciimonas sp. PCH181]PUA19242.1 xylulokinase [Glaciimonas sp. PCH181]